MGSRRAVHLLAIAAAAATLLLLSVGGVVTSRDAGMVFEDWPLSNGSVNPDGWLGDPDQRAEHGHRILGAIVGLLTLALAIALQRKEPRRFVRVLGWTALGAVCVQGLLGGLRVTEVSGALALVHGCFGQAFLALMVAIAYLTSRDATEEPVEEGASTQRLFVCSVAVLITVYLQVVLGAQLRHALGPVNTHILGAVFVAGTVLWLFTVTLIQFGDRRALRRPVLLLTALLVVQVSLGLATRSTLAGLREGTEYSLAEVLLPTAHQTMGGLMLIVSMVVTLRAFRRAAPALAAEAAA